MNKTNANLIIGTAQFGSNYGITNKKGRMSSKEIKRIILNAYKEGILYFDTAPLYGNAEKKLGRYLKKESKVITKIPEIKGSFIDMENVKNVEEIFLNSLKNLKLKKVYALLTHSSKDFLKKNSKYLIDLLKNLKKEGLVENIGVSIYEKKEFFDIIKVFKPDIIQLPISIVDQRLLENNFLSLVKKMGIEIHARSIFLQGLLVSNVNHIPKKLFFVKNSLIKFQKKIDNNGLNPVEASLFFVKNIKQIDKIIIGFTSYNEFKEIINKNKKRIELKNFTQFKITNKKVLNPTNW